MSLVHGPAGEAGPLRRWSLYLFARYLEIPLLALSYQFLRGRYRRVGTSRPVRAFLAVAAAAPFGYAGDTARAVPAQRVFDLIDGLEGTLAVGPCRCRSAHGGCDHPIETDIVIRAGVEAFTRAFPDEYRPISKAEAKAIVADCSRQGMWQMVFVHCPLGEQQAHEEDLSGNDPGQTVGGSGRWPRLGHEYVICNCCTCGCMPYILNREVGQRFYPLLRGDWVARTDAARCRGQGACVTACPFGARAVVGGQARLVDVCFGCGLCAAACPEGAIEMQARGEGV